MITKQEAIEMFKKLGIDESDPKRKKAIELLESYGLEDYDQKREALRNAFLHMHHIDENSPLRKWLESLIKKSMIYGQNSRDINYIRKHNTFVKNYVLRVPQKLIARQQIINTRTVYRDIDFILDKMMIFAYGFDGIRPAQKKVSKTLKIRAHNCRKSYRLVRIEYFIKSNKQELDLLIRQAKEFLPDISEPIDAPQYRKLKKQMKELFCRYKDIDSEDPLRSWMLKIANLHKTFVDLSKDEIYARQHKAFEMKYFNDQSYKEIADSLQLTSDTVFRYVDQTIIDIICFLYKVPKDLLGLTNDKTAGNNRQNNSITYLDVLSTHNHTRISGCDKIYQQ